MGRGSCRLEGVYSLIVDRPTHLAAAMVKATRSRPRFDSVEQLIVEGRLLRSARAGMALLATALTLVLSACVVSQPISTPSALPSPTTSAAAPTATPTPALPESASTRDFQDDAVAALVDENGQTACTVLALKPATDVDEIVDFILVTYGVESLDVETQRVLASRFITESAAEYCPEEIDRVRSDLAGD